MASVVCQSFFAVIVDTASQPDRPAYPTSHQKKRDWNEIETDLKKKEDDEKPEGEEALNKLFKDIYGNADEDTRRC